MRAVFGLVALLIVLAVVGISIRNELRATSKFLPGSAAAASNASSAPFGGTSSPTVSQFQQELDKTMRGAADRAASAGGAADAN
jgi:hypothetical protein